jgi:hypothetical protein
MKNKQKILKKNIGLCHERTQYDKGWGVNFEKVFQEQWDKINRERSGFSCPEGIAQALFYVDKASADKFDGPNRDDTGLFQSPVYRLTGREQRIIATIIQWLGTNCGQSFLDTCFKKCGYQLQSIKDFKEPKRPKPVQPQPSRLDDVNTKFKLLNFLAQLKI